MLTTITRTAIAVVLLSALYAAAAPAAAQESVNAALRYWMAFAMMQDFPADPATTQLLQTVANGDAAWDNRLDPVVERNKAAITAMQRASRLSRCDWGLEYELGPATPLYHLSRARVLARLNTLYGLRAATRGDTAAAVESWVAGLRFARHLAQDESIIGVLTAKAALDADLRVIAHAAPTLDAQSKARLAEAVSAVPDYGFDWAIAMRRDGDAGAKALDQLLKSNNRPELFQQWFGEAMPPTTNVGPEDITAYRAYMAQAEAAFRLPYENARNRIAALRPQGEKLNPVVKRMMVSLDKANDARQEIARQREAALKALR